MGGGDKRRLPLVGGAPAARGGVLPYETPRRGGRWGEGEVLWARHDPASAEAVPSDPLPEHALGVWPRPLILCAGAPGPRRRRVAAALADALGRAGARVVTLPLAPSGARRAEVLAALAEAEAVALAPTTLGVDAPPPAGGAPPLVLLAEGSALLGCVRPALSVSVGERAGSPAARALAARADLDLVEPSPEVVGGIAAALVAALTSRRRCPALAG